MIIVSLLQFIISSPLGYCLAFLLCLLFRTSSLERPQSARRSRSGEEIINHLQTFPRALFLAYAANLYQNPQTRDAPLFPSESGYCECYVVFLASGDHLPIRRWLATRDFGRNWNWSDLGFGCVFFNVRHKFNFPRRL